MRVWVSAKLGLALVCAALALLEMGRLGEAAPPPQAKPIRVVIKVLDPFVMKQNEQWIGFSIDLWQTLAQRLNLTFEYVEVATVTDQLNAVQTGAGEVAITGISMTPEREERVDFSHPYFNAGLQILTAAQSSSPLSSFITFFQSPGLWQILGIGAILALGMAHVVWVIERRGNPAFPRGYLLGVWEGLWWVLNIVANGEYGDKNTRSVFKRIVTIAFWLLGVALIAQFTATVTSDLTVQQLSGSIAGPGDLPGKRIATVRGTTAAQYLRDQRIQATEVMVADEAFQLLEADQVQAVVYDAPVLLYYANTKGRGRVQVVGPIFKEETYGIALPPGSALRKPINETLLKLRQDGTYETLYTKWFGATR